MIEKTEVPPVAVRRFEGEVRRFLSALVLKQELIKLVKDPHPLPQHHHRRAVPGYASRRQRSPDVSLRSERDREKADLPPSQRPN